MLLKLRVYLNGFLNLVSYSRIDELEMDQRCVYTLRLFCVIKYLEEYIVRTFDFTEET